MRLSQEGVNLVLSSTFSVIAPILWNDLPTDIKSIDDVNKFKSNLKTFLFTQVYELLGFLFCIFATLYICNDFRIFSFFIQTFLKHCKAYKRYINTLLFILLFILFIL